MRRPIVLTLALALAASPLFAAGDIPQLKASAEAAVKAALAAPSDYAANWGAAEACRSTGTRW